MIGNFDGVHRGHQRVLAEAAGDGALPLVVITFWPHPLSVVRPDSAPKLLADLATRIELLKRCGAHEVRVVTFTPVVAAMSPSAFLERFVFPLNPARVVVGENFRFGHKAAGDVRTLEELGRGRFAVSPLALETLDGSITCSTLIREAISQGDVELAAQHLGRPFRARGVVVMGDQRGRQLGFPTANLRMPTEMAVPEDGVYAGYVTRTDRPGAQAWPAAISVGTNPTFDGADRRVESYVIDRTDLELYGIEIAVDVTARLRGQVKFDGVESLIDQMREDVELARQLL